MKNEYVVKGDLTVIKVIHKDVDYEVIIDSNDLSLVDSYKTLDEAVKVADIKRQEIFPENKRLKT